MKLADHIRLIFCVFSISAIKQGKQLEATAQTADEIAAAKAFRRVFYGTIAIVTAYVIGLLAVFFFNMPFLGSGDKRYGTVQEDGSVRYIQDVEKYASQESLGLSEFQLSAGDRVIIFFDKNDTISEAYPKEYHDSYTETRLFAILGSALLGLTLILIYALIICRLTPFGSAWYRYLKKITAGQEVNTSPKANALIYVVSLLVALVICLPQIVGILNNLKRMAEINEFGQTIKNAQQAADDAESMIDNLDDLDEKLESNSGIDAAQSASDKIHDIMAGLKGTETSETEDTSE